MLTTPAQRPSSTATRILAALHSNGFCFTADLARWLDVPRDAVVAGFDEIATADIALHRTHGWEDGAILARELEAA